MTAERGKIGYEKSYNQEVASAILNLLTQLGASIECLRMPRILLIKTSSLGDVVHNFPVAGDIRARFPDAVIDWVVEEAYVPLVRLHPAIHEVLPVAFRRWRKELLHPATWREFRAFRKALAARTYDLCIDTQGLLKSALIAGMVPAVRHGFDAETARERVAARFYDVVHHVDQACHAVQRNRLLAAKALRYCLSGAVDYGLKVPGPVSGMGPRCCVLFHGTSRNDKLWPVEDWIALGLALQARGYRCVLPWGSAAEQARSQAIAAALDMASVPARMDYGQMTDLISAASAVIGVDTGLVHLAAALGRPVVALFTGSDPELTGVYGAARARNLGARGAAPTPAAVLQALRDIQAIQ